ncbi:MAG: NAD(P)H-dependent oxidoreductase subunit E [bacterium]
MSLPTTIQIDAALDKVLGRHEPGRSALIAVLQDVNAEFGHLPGEALRRVSDRLAVPLSEVYHVATFYTAFSLKPRGQHVVKVCAGTACHVRGAPRIVDDLMRLLDVVPGETTSDGRFTLETVNCLGACALGPVVVLDGRYYQASPAMLPKLLKSVDAQVAPVAADGPGESKEEVPLDVSRLMEQQVGVVVCGGTGCQAYGCETVATAMKQELDRLGVSAKVDFVQSGCHGFCDRGPIVVVRPENIFYQKVTLQAVPAIVRETVIGGRVIEALLYRDPVTNEPKVREEDIPFYAKQTRIVLGDNGRISPTRIDHYLSRCHGYEAFAKALHMQPEAIIDEISRSGLRGRGGGGFPTGRKWTSCRKAHGSPKYVICNADEGDPGAYMDRSLLEGNPHRVIEGMLIGAFAIGASEGYVYVRDEYPLAVKHINLAVAQAREKGFLGRNILGSGFDFDIRVARGGGAFVCGESTALMASLEGKPGEPRAKYIHTVESGLWGKPSNLNNVETWANVPIIITRGAEWYAAIGSGTSKGTKIFSVVGKVINTGLAEVPMGMTLRELIFDIGGGVPNGKAFKAVQTGGPSGGCLPESMLDLPIGFDELTEAGSMMGSGGLIVMDETSCMVDVARYFLAFLQDESCGKCVPCREGVGRMLEILTDICQGRGKDGDSDLLSELAQTTADGSLCALGGSAPNPVLSMLRYFAEEYRAHVQDHRCPAKVCKALITFRILEDKCTGCTACAKKCPKKVISGEKKKRHAIDQSGCIKCGACLDACKFEAVEVI